MITLVLACSWTRYQCSGFFRSVSSGNASISLVKQSAQLSALTALTASISDSPLIADEKILPPEGAARNHSHSSPYSERSTDSSHKQLELVPINLRHLPNGTVPSGGVFLRLASGRNFHIRQPRVLVENLNSIKVSKCTKSQSSSSHSRHRSRPPVTDVDNRTVSEEVNKTVMDILLGTKTSLRVKDCRAKPLATDDDNSNENALPIDVESLPFKRDYDGQPNSTGGPSRDSSKVTQAWPRRKNRFRRTYSALPDHRQRPGSLLPQAGVPPPSKSRYRFVLGSYPSTWNLITETLLLKTCNLPHREPQYSNQSYRRPDLRFIPFVVRLTKHRWWLNGDTTQNLLRNVQLIVILVKERTLVNQSLNILSLESCSSSLVIVCRESYIDIYSFIIKQISSVIK